MSLTDPELRAAKRQDNPPLERPARTYGFCSVNIYAGRSSAATFARHTVEPESNRLTYRTPNEGDAAFFACLAVTDGVAQYIGDLPVPKADDGTRLFVLMLEGTPAGIAGFVRSGALEGRDMELICVVSPPWQGKGFAGEACRAILLWAFGECGWPRVLACVHNANAPGRALAHNLGFREIGKRFLNPEVAVLEKRRAGEQ